MYPANGEYTKFSNEACNLADVNFISCGRNTDAGVRLTLRKLQSWNIMCGLIMRDFLPCKLSIPTLL